MRIICLFNLKADASVADYEAWAKGVDIPGVKALPSVSGFTVHRSTGLLGSQAPAPYRYIEIIDVTGIAPFTADVMTDAFQAAAAPFRDFADDPIFILTEDL